jgi:putative ABC transport system ATP-binding protein
MIWNSIDKYEGNLVSILKPDKRFFLLASVYGVGIGILTLAGPIAVQALLNTVVNTAITPFIILLAALLFVVLLLSITLIACRDYAMELFQRRFFARISSEAALRLTHADQRHMDGINRAELVNRFFEIMHVQKNVPALLTDGFFIGLQSIVGLVVVSFYHPFLFVYNIFFVGCLLLIWKIWYKAAIKKALALSDSKYAIVQWLEEMARVNHSFKSEQSIKFALERTDNYTSSYLSKKKSYFRTTFTQNVAFLLLYSIASACLLGLGGVLVAKSQLSLGQLVGAELIMSAIFYSTSRLGYYARIYYDLRTNLHKLSYFFKLPLENNAGKLVMDHTIERRAAFDNVITNYRNHSFNFSCDLNNNSKVLIKTSDAAGSKLFLDLIKGYRQPDQGRISIGGHELADFDYHRLRNNILSVDSISVVEGSINRFFNLYAPNLTQAQINAALQLVELDQIVNDLPRGLNTHIVPSGYPLLQDEIIRLKLAAIIAAKPAILVITEIFDIVPYQLRKRILKQLCQNPEMMLITFTNRKEWHFYDQYILMDEEGTHNFTDAAAMKNYLETQHLEQQ